MRASRAILAASAVAVLPSEGVLVDHDPAALSRHTLVGSGIDGYAYTGAAGALAYAPSGAGARITRSTVITQNGRPSWTLADGKDLFTNTSLGLGDAGAHCAVAVYTLNALPAGGDLAHLGAVGAAGTLTSTYVGLTGAGNNIAGAGGVGGVQKSFADTGVMVAMMALDASAKLVLFVEGRKVVTGSPVALTLGAGDGFRLADAITGVMEADLFRRLVYQGYPDRAKRTKIFKALRRIYAVPDKLPMLVASGTSITAGVQGAVGGYVTLTATDLGLNATTSEINFGISGATTGLSGGTGGLLALYHGHTDDWYSPLAGGHDVAIVEGGANDQAAGYSTQDTIDNLLARCDGLRAIGWKVVLMGVPPGDGDSSLASFQTFANTVNAALRTNWQGHADAFADPDTIPELGTPAGHADSGDHLHFGAHGDGLLRDLVKPPVQTLAGL